MVVPRVVGHELVRLLIDPNRDEFNLTFLNLDWFHQFHTHVGRVERENRVIEFFLGKLKE